MNLTVRPLFALLLLAFPMALACDSEFLFGPPVEIDDDRPRFADDDDDDDDGAGEGEGEGDGVVVDGEVCDGARTVLLGERIDMTTARARHAAARLVDGRVLLAGGHDDSYLTIRGAELYDSATGTFAPTGALLEARYDFALVALPDGRALAVGGFNNDIDAPDSNGDLASTELYDPETGEWSAGPSLPEARTGASAVVVDENTVLIFGGQTGAVSIPLDVLVFHVDTGALVGAGRLSQQRTAHTAHVMSDGRTLMVGGYYTGARPEVDVIGVDGAAAATAAVPGARRSACAANDGATGRLLVFGGYGTAGPLDDVQAFDPATDTWSQAGTLGTARYACDAVAFSCTTLVCGGADVTSCEAWDHGATSPVPVIDDTGSEFSGTLTLLDDDTALLAGGFIGEEGAIVSTARVLSLAE